MQSNAITFSIQGSTTPPSVRSDDHKTASPQADAPKPPTKSDASGNIDQLKGILAEHNINLRISTDPTTQQVVVQLVDELTGEPVRQIPSEVSLRLEANFLRMRQLFLDRF